jgi:hypothetical protein
MHCHPACTCSVAVRMIRTRVQGRSNDPLVIRSGGLSVKVYDAARIRTVATTRDMCRNGAKKSKSSGHGRLLIRNQQVGGSSPLAGSITNHSDSTHTCGVSLFAEQPDPCGSTTLRSARWPGRGQAGDSWPSHCPNNDPTESTAAPSRCRRHVAEYDDSLAPRRCPVLQPGSRRPVEIHSPIPP